MKTFLRSLADAWRRSPAIRFAARAACVAAVSYVVSALVAGDPLDLHALAAAAAIAGGDSIVKYLTPLEPFVGPNFTKPSRVEVPPPPEAVPEPKA